MVDIDEGYQLVQGQGHWVKGQGQIYGLLNFCCCCNNSCTIGRTLTKLGMRVDIDENYLLIKGQGRWVKGQGQIHNCLKNYSCLLLTNYWSD